MNHRDPVGGQLGYGVWGLWLTYSLHRSSFLGLPFGILNIELVKPEKGTTRETIGIIIQKTPPARVTPARGSRISGGGFFGCTHMGTNQGHPFLSPKP